MSGFIVILLGLALFILLAFRGYNLMLSAIGCSCYADFVRKGRAGWPE